MYQRRFLPSLILSDLALYILVTVLAILSVLDILPSSLPYTPVTTFLAFGFGVMHAGLRLGWIKASLLIFLVFIVGLAFESIGVATGAIYGPYHYNNLLGPKFLGLVPYLIPLAWFMMAYPSYLISDRLVGSRFNPIVRILLVSLVGGIAMTAWDLGMDPLMVKAGHWTWEVQGAYFGVPIQNFFGWWLTTFTALILFQWLSLRSQPIPGGAVPDQWAIWLYAITGLSTVIVDTSIGLPGPALVGLFAMTPWVVIGFLSGKNNGWLSTKRADMPTGP